MILSPDDRLAAIRGIAHSLDGHQAQKRAARLSLGVRTERKASPLPMPMEARRRRLQAAIAFLQARGTLVSILDRDALVRRYRITAKRENYLADEVVAYAIERGFEADNG